MDENAKYMRMKTTLIFIFLTLFSLAFVSALGVDIPIPAYNNNTANVNNSQYLRGYTPFNLPYLTSFTESDPIFTSWLTGTYFVPYTGATGDVDILPYDFKASRIEATGDLQGKDIIGETLNVPDIPHYGDGVSNFNNDIPYLVSGDVMNFNSGLIYSDANANAWFGGSINSKQNITASKIDATKVNATSVSFSDNSVTIQNTKGYNLLNITSGSNGYVWLGCNNPTFCHLYSTSTLYFANKVTFSDNPYPYADAGVLFGSDIYRWKEVYSMNYSVMQGIRMRATVLGTCNAGLKNYISANTTGTYGCNGTNWVLIF